MDITSLFAREVAGGSALAIPLALAGGLVSSLNPCCVALYPAAASACCAVRPQKANRAWANAAAFVLGVAVATTILGALAAAAGRITTGIGTAVHYTVALVPLAMGAYLLGWLPLRMPARNRQSQGVGVAAAFSSGLLLSLIIGPCGTPILAAVLSYAAYEGNVRFGSLLLLAYGLGAAVPVLLVGAAAGGIAAKLELGSGRIWTNRLSGGALLGLGFYLLWIA